MYYSFPVTDNSLLKSVITGNRFSVLVKPQENLVVQLISFQISYQTTLSYVQFFNLFNATIYTLLKKRRHSSWNSENIKAGN
jgi:hypothetical protein